MDGATGARIVAAVGAVCGIVALWPNAGAGGGHDSYFHDRTLGVAMLLLAAATLALLLAAQLLERHGLDVGAGVVGAVLFGLMLYIPVFWSPSTLDNVGVGGWLGLGTALAPLAMLSLPPPDARPPARGSLRRLAALLALAGAGCAIGSVWLGWNTPSITYWNRALQTNGICLIVLAALAAALVAGSLLAPASPFVSDGALVGAGAVLGFAAYLPVNAAFGHLGTEGSGAWLGSSGAGLLLLAVLLMRGALAPPRRLGH